MTGVYCLAGVDWSVSRMISHRGHRYEAKSFVKTRPCARMLNQTGDNDARRYQCRYHANICLCVRSVGQKLKFEALASNRWNDGFQRRSLFVTVDQGKWFVVHWWKKPQQRRIVSCAGVLSQMGSGFFFCREKLEVNKGIQGCISLILKSAP